MCTLVNIKTASKELGVSKDSIKKLIRNDEISYENDSGQYSVCLDEVRQSLIDNISFEIKWFGMYVFIAYKNFVIPLCPCCWIDVLEENTRYQRCVCCNEKITVINFKEFKNLAKLTHFGEKIELVEEILTEQIDLSEFNLDLNLDILFDVENMTISNRIDPKILL